MTLIKDKFPDTYPSWPVDITQKSSQITCRETALKGVEEKEVSLYIINCSMIFPL